MDKGLFTEYFLVRFLINSVSMVILVQLIYYHVYKKKNLFAPFFLLNFIIFLIAYMLIIMGSFNNLGSAFGLLAAFSLLRFRTDTLSMKDMTYLFIVMTIGLINSAMKGTFIEIVAINGLIIAVVFIVDGNLIIRNERTRIVEFEGLENITPERRPFLLEELRKLTGLDIRKMSIEHYDFVKKKIEIKIYFRD
jgi:hypothetical protein